MYPESIQENGSIKGSLLIQSEGDLGLARPEDIWEDDKTKQKGKGQRCQDYENDYYYQLQTTTKMLQMEVKESTTT